MQPMEEIYQQYARTVYRYLLGLTRDGDLAEELTQETFYQAIRTSERFDGSCQISTWLCGIARHVLQTHRRRHPVTEDVDEMELAAPSAEQTVLEAEGGAELLLRLRAQPEPGREVLNLRIFGGLSFREIGAAMGKTETWARVTYYRAKERLRKEVLADGESLL